MSENNRNIEKLLSSLRFDDKPDPNHRDRLEKELLHTLNKPEPRTINIGRIIMKSKITKLTAAAVVIAAVFIGINQFGGPINGSSLAFGEVLGYIQKYSYTFDLSVDTVTEKQDSITFTMKAMVWELGRMRVDFAKGYIGEISSITDLNAGKTILLFHQNKAAVIKKDSYLNKNTGAGSIVSFCNKPIENLWNVRNGTEEELGEKDTNGQKVTGFRVFQKDRYFEYDITIWAESETGIPHLVEVIAQPFDESYPSIIWTMENFNLDAELDKELFSLDLPDGYTLAYQEDLEKLEVETEPSAESEKIVKMLELWKQGKNNKAIELLLEIDWTKEIEFGKETYIFSITEKGYIALKAEDQKEVMEEIMTVASTMRKIAKEALALGRVSVKGQNYEGAERYFDAALQLGKLLDRDPERMLIVRLVGLTVKRLALKEMINFYTTTNNQKKLQVAENRLRTAEAEVDKIKKQVRTR